MVNDTPKPKPKRRRTKKPKLCDHGYPAIPDLRGCATCWTKHPGYVKPKPKVQNPPEGIRQVTCEKCFLPAQAGAPPLVRIVGAPGVPGKYEHRVCPADKMAGATPSRARRRLFRRGLTSALRRHIRKMLGIERSRRERAVVLRIATVRAERLLAAKEKDARRKALAAG